MRSRSQAVENTQATESTPDAPPPRRNVLDDARQRAHDAGEKADAQRRKLEADGGPNVFPSGAEDELVTVEVPGDVYQPRQYNSIHTSKFAMTTRVRQGETRADAARRCLAEIRVLQREDFEAKLQQFIKQFGRMAEVLHGGGNG